MEYILRTKRRGGVWPGQGLATGNWGALKPPARHRRGGKAPADSMTCSDAALGLLFLVFVPLAFAAFLRSRTNAAAVSRLELELARLRQLLEGAAPAGAGAGPAPPTAPPPRPLPLPAMPPGPAPPH